MCSPYTRGVYVLLKNFREDGTPLLLSDLDSMIDQYDYAKDYRLSMASVTDAFRDLLADGSVEELPGSRMRITQSGLRTMLFAESFMSPD